MPNLLDPNLTKALCHDREFLSETHVPIITVAGTFREDLKRFYGLDHHSSTPDLVFSRAHFSMPLGVATQAWGDSVNPEKAWLADPTNYVSPQQWHNIQLTEQVGKTIARHPFLQYLKAVVDRFGRNQLPILKSITPPLLYLTEEVQRPVLCFHIAAGNILVNQGKQVVQVVTDPHVRPEYVEYANHTNIQYCVFDERTRLEFLEVAAIHHIPVDPNRVIVTGPPIDPRILRARAHKTAWRSGTLKLCITTGGIGTNKVEIRQLLSQLLPQLRRHSCPYQVLVYAGTQADIAQMVTELAKHEHIPLSKLGDESARLRLIYHPEILEANELLIQYGFPWADGFMTKPSGDMAYDAVASGSFVLTLQEWGVWEERVREIFEQKDIARKADVSHIVEQLSVLQTTDHGTSWIERAMNHAFGIEKLFLLGSEKILRVVKQSEK